MVGRLAQRRRTVVTSRALAVSTGIVCVSRRCPGNRRIVAGITLSAGSDVRHRLHLGILGKVCAAVAGRAQTGQPSVIHGGGSPGHEAADVASVTLSNAGNMINWACQRIGEEIGSIVAGRALPGHAAVVHLGRLEGSEAGVATVALRTRRNMGRRLAKSSNAVVAAGTAARYRRRSCCVIERGARPGNRRTMASIALGGSADMGCRLGLGILGKKNAAVTSRALARHAGMVHGGRRPGDETADVAGIALRRGRNVHVRLRLRIGEIVGAAMTARALPDRADVVHLRRLESRETGMTAVALLRGRNVVGGFSQRTDTVMAVRTAAGDRRHYRGMIWPGGSRPRSR